MSAPRPGLSLLVCSDMELLKEKIDELARAHPPVAGEWKKLIFWGDTPPDNRFWESLIQQGLFAENRLIIVRQAQEWSAATWKELSHALASPREGVWPLFCLENDWDRGKAKIPAHVAKSRCMVFAESKKWVWLKPPLSEASLREYTQKTAAALKLKLPPKLLDAFLQSVAPDAGSIKNALDKLKLLCGDAEVTAEALSSNGANPENDAFACLRKLENGDFNGAWQEISRDGTGSSLFFLVSLLARDLRQLWSINAGASPYLRPNESSFKRALAGKLGFRGLSRGFAALAEAEWSVKSGKLPPERAGEILCERMARLFADRAKDRSH